jgi:hypothetical protein
MLAEMKSKIRLNVTNSFGRPVDAVAHERLRLRVLFSVAFLKLFNFIGGAWDIQWHVEIGRDSLWIPPHLLVMFAFTAGLALTVALIAHESYLASAGQAQSHSLRVGSLQAPAAAFGISFGYLFALLSGGLDELWHEIFGIDATLWSPPHLMIMAATVVVDFSLMLGIAVSARRLGYGFNLKSPLFWGLVLTGAYAFESVNFQMGEAFIVGLRHSGMGLYGLLFPILVGVFLPLSMVTLVCLARRFWVVLPALGLTLLLQYLATGVAAAGFAILKPVSVIEQYVIQNPESTAAMARQFAQSLGFNGLIGFEQAWTMSLSLLPLALVSSLALAPRARRHMLAAAPVFSIAMVLFSFISFKQMPALQGYPITGFDLPLACGISALGGLLTGSLGLRLSRLVPDTE